MKPSAHIQAAIELLALIEEKTDTPADQLAADYFRNRRYIGSKDRRTIANLVYGVLRHRAHCDWWCLRRGLSPLQVSALKASRARLLAYLWLVQDTARAEIGILFSGEKYAPTRLDDRERKLFSVNVDETPDPLWVQGEYPEWMHPHLQTLYGDKLLDHMQAYTHEAPVDLRVNSLKATREDVQSQLAEDEIVTDPLPSTPWGLRCEQRTPFSHNPLLKEGLFEIQDEGSQLLAQAVDAQPGEAVLDYCAGAGGKTLALAAQMQNKGRLVATDIASWRLKRSKERLRRAGVHNAECRVLESTNDKWIKRQKGKFDRVLVDAPCSGTGTWRRNPDQKWRLRQQDLAELPCLQEEILNAAAPLVKTGGRLIYATCSFLHQENEAVLEAFLAQNPQFKLLEPPQRLSPLENNTDGFFVAQMVKDGNLTE